jgi:hypothetical protein
MSLRPFDLQGTLPPEIRRIIFLHAAKNHHTDVWKWKLRNIWNLDEFPDTVKELLKLRISHHEKGILNNRLRGLRNNEAKYNKIAEKIETLPQLPDKERMIKFKLQDPRDPYPGDVPPVLIAARGDRELYEETLDAYYTIAPFELTDLRRRLEGSMYSASVNAIRRIKTLFIDHLR